MAIVADIALPSQEQRQLSVPQASAAVQSLVYGSYAANDMVLVAPKTLKKTKASPHKSRAPTPPRQIASEPVVFLANEAPEQATFQNNLAQSTYTPVATSQNVHGIQLPNHISSACVIDAAEKYQVPSIILLGILKVESGGRVGQVARNTNKTYDLGPAQLNTAAWALYFNQKYGITPDTMTHDMCASLLMMGYALRTEINRAKGDFWRGVGNYHSRTPDKHQRYIYAVDGASKAMLNRRFF